MSPGGRWMMTKTAALMTNSTGIVTRRRWMMYRVMIKLLAAPIPLVRYLAASEK